MLILFSRTFIKSSLAIGNRTYESGREYLAGVTDQINGIKDIKSNALEESRLNWYRSVTQRMVNEQVEYSKIKTKSQLYYKAASAILIAVFIFTAVHLFRAQPTQLMFNYIIFSRLWPRVTGIQGSLEQMATTIPSYNAVILFKMSVQVLKNLMVKKILMLNQFCSKKELNVRNVYFRYDQNQLSTPCKILIYLFLLIK